MALSIFLLLLAYLTSIWGLNKLFKSKFVCWFFIILFFLPIVSIATSKMEITNPIFFVWMSAGYIFYGVSLYFSLSSLLIFVIGKFYKNFNQIRWLKFSLYSTIIVLICGYINAQSPQIHYIEKSASFDMKICFLADIHIGNQQTEILLRKLSSLINSENVDLVLIGGDMFDRPAFSKYKEITKQTFKSIRSKFGIYTVFGNHEGYCGQAEAKKLLDECGINLLYDESCVINGQVCILGRADCYDARRKPLKEIFPKTELPVIVVDHNPFALNEAAEYNVFMQLSGHTHGGQLFPCNFLVNMQYKYPTGEPLRIKNMSAYITPGFGFWGAPFRIGNTPEIVIINFKKERR